MDYLKWAKETFINDRFATKAAGIEIEKVSHRFAACSLKITDVHLNAQNAVMGGAIFTLADFAFAIASNTDMRPVVSQTSQITYLSAPKGDTLIAEANCVKAGKSTCFFVTEIYDNLKRHIATVTTTGFYI